MTTLHDRPEHEGSGSGRQDEALCPHCGSAMAADVELSWPPEPALCPTCERWVGRGRATVAGDGGGPEALEGGIPADQATSGGGNGATRRRQRRPGRPGSSERRSARALETPAPPPRPTSHSQPTVPAGMGGPGAQVPGDGSAQGTPGAAASGLGFGAQVAAETSSPTSQAVKAPSPHAPEPEGEPEAGELAVGDGEPARAPDEAVALEGAPAEGGSEANGASAGDGVGVGGAPVGDHGTVGGDAGVRGYYEVPKDRTAHFPLIAEPPRRGPFSFLRRRRQAVHPPAAQPPRIQRTRRAKVLRALPFVLLGIGVLLLAEGAVTVLWQEPISALLTASGQQALGDDLKKLEAQGAARAAESRKQMILYQQRAAVNLNRTAKPGQAIGRLKIPKTGLNMVVVQSTDEESLKKGPAHYRETPLPGKKGHWSVGIAGHRTTYEAPFRHNDSLKRGNKIYFTLPYGRFTYSVAKVKIVDAGYSKAFVPQGKDLLVLTACHPLYSAAQRILVYAQLTKREPLGGANQAARPAPKARARD